MGVPGCLDYAMLTLVKQGKLSARVEKDLNQSLNVWIRCPCAVVAGYLQLLDPLVHPAQHLSSFHRALILLSGVHSMCDATTPPRSRRRARPAPSPATRRRGRWNGCFFMYRTVDARTRFVLAHKPSAAKGATPTDPPSRPPASTRDAPSGGLAYHPLTGVAMPAAPAAPPML